MAAEIHQLDDHRQFDIGTPARCYRCETAIGVSRQGGEGGYVWGCEECGHPAD